MDQSKLEIYTNIFGSYEKVGVAAPVEPAFTNSECPLCFHCMNVLKLDRVGPIEYKPSIDKLHHFVQK